MLQSSHAHLDQVVRDTLELSKATLQRSSHLDQIVRDALEMPKAPLQRSSVTSSSTNGAQRQELDDVDRFDFTAFV